MYRWARASVVISSVGGTAAGSSSGDGSDVCMSSVSGIGEASAAAVGSDARSSRDGSTEGGGVSDSSAAGPVSGMTGAGGIDSDADGVSTGGASIDSMGGFIPDGSLSGAGCAWEVCSTCILSEDDPIEKLDRSSIRCRAA
jgi:hypothetical protein